MPQVQRRIPLSKRPPYYKSGEAGFLLPHNLIEQDDEKALGMRLLCDRKLFGLCYLNLTRDYFWSMPRESGVFVRSFVPSSDIISDLAFPGDIDLLVIPYEKDELVVSRALGIELKITRASYENQGKSPNRFGFSQAQSLAEQGFPFVAVIHLIVSDRSPRSEWREVQTARIVDPESGEVELGDSKEADLMPADLIERGYGRLVDNRPDENIGVVSAYFSEDRIWQPMGEPSMQSPEASVEIIDAIGDYYHANYEQFMDIPRYDP